MITFNCSHCGARLGAEFADSGSTAVCAKCSKTIEIPSQSSEEARNYSLRSHESRAGLQSGDNPAFEEKNDTEGKFIIRAYLCYIVIIGIIKNIIDPRRFSIIDNIVILLFLITFVACLIYFAYHWERIDKFKLKQTIGIPVLYIIFLALIIFHLGTIKDTEFTIIENGPRTGAVCNDGWISSATGQGACSHHGGVAEWIRMSYNRNPTLIERIQNQVKTYQLLWILTLSLPPVIALEHYDKKKSK